MEENTWEALGQTHTCPPILPMDLDDGAVIRCVGCGTTKVMILSSVSPGLHTRSRLEDFGVLTREEALALVTGGNPA